MKKLSELFTRKIPTKNYYIVLIVSVLVIVISLYARSLYLSYKESMKNSSPFFDKNINQINTDDLDFALSETNEVLLYVSYTGNENIYNNEKKLFNTIRRKDLLDKVIYWNITDIYRDGKYLEILRTKYPDNSDYINFAPLLMYIKDGEVKEVINSGFDIINYEDFNEIVDKYEIK